MVDAREALEELAGVVDQLDSMCTRLRVEGVVVRLSPLVAWVLGVPDAAPCSNVVYEANRWLVGGGLNLLQQIEEAAALGNTARVAELTARLVDTTKGIVAAVQDVAKDLGETVTVSARLRRFWDEVVVRSGEEALPSGWPPWLWALVGLGVVGAAGAAVVALRR